MVVVVVEVVTDPGHVVVKRLFSRNVWTMGHVDAMKTSWTPVFVSLTTRLFAAERNAIVEPSLLICGNCESPLPNTPTREALRKNVVGRHCVGVVVVGFVGATKSTQVFRTNTFSKLLFVFVTRFVALEANATYCPSLLSEGYSLI